jgi:hypothetical protein
MRAPTLVCAVALLALSACAAQRAQATSSPDATRSPVPLQACETRELTMDGADLVIQANVDQTVASILVVRAPDDDARAKAFEDARKVFGDPRPDNRTQSRQYKWGLTQLVDMCGRPVMPSNASSPTPSPG